jgi:hypothetical protein
LWFEEISTKLLAKYKPTVDCNFLFGNSSVCQAYKQESLEFLDSYKYAVRSNVQELKELLSVCTKTAFIDEENSIDHFLHVWNQDEQFPQMVKGNSFFQQRYSWNMSGTWLFRKLLSSRLKAFATSGIIGFWERFCLKYCIKQPEQLSVSHNPIINSKATNFKPQKLGSNLTSLFFIMFIISYIDY